METISAGELNTLLTDPALSPANIRAASRAIHIAQYPGGDRLKKRFVEESGVYWLLLWPALSMNTYGIVKTQARLVKPVENIHFMRFLRLSPIRPSTKVCAVDKSGHVTELSFDLHEGALYFMNQDCVELRRQLTGITTVHADLSTRRLTFS